MLRCLLPLRKHPGDVLALQAKTEFLISGSPEFKGRIPEPALRTQRTRSERPLRRVRVRSDFEPFKNCAHAQFIEYILNF